MEELRRALAFHDIQTQEGVLLSAYSSFRIGGRARLACFPKTREELVRCLRLVREQGCPHLVIGKGSNVVFDDRGFDGAVILSGGVKEMRIEGNHLISDTGASLASLANLSRQSCLSGLEFAHGIPGTLGGAVLMNAGAFGGCMADICLSSVYYDSLLDCVGVFQGEAQEFDTRSSIYAKESRYTVLGAELCLHTDEKEAIEARMADFAARRKSTQPLDLPSAGSVFKRPVGHYAGKLIEDCRLKGVRVGGAEVSQKHAGFIVNRGGATAADVRALVDLIRERVLEETGVELECEIRFL